MPTAKTLNTRNERKQRRKPKHFKATVNKCKHLEGFNFEKMSDGVMQSCKLNCGFRVKFIGR